MSGIASIIRLASFEDVLIIASQSGNGTHYSQIRSKWEVTRVIIQHKLGECPIGEISVLIAVSSPHRTESLEAVDFAINELKRTVPIWKKVSPVVFETNGLGIVFTFCAHPLPFPFSI